MSKIRYWDNRIAHWMMRHFFILFFEAVLLILFFVFLYSTLRTMDVASMASPENATQQLLVQQTAANHILIVLIFLNSFWMLYVLNGINRLRVILKDLSFHLSRRRPRGQDPQSR